MSMVTAHERPRLAVYRQWCRHTGITYSICDSIDDLRALLDRHAPHKLREELSAAVPTLTRLQPKVRARPSSAPASASLLVPQYDPRGSYTDSTTEPGRLRPTRPKSAGFRRPPNLPASDEDGEEAEAEEYDESEHATGADEAEGDPSWLPAPGHRPAPRAPPHLQMVMSRVIASAQQLALEVDRQARGTGSHRGVEAARISTLRTHIDALVTLKAACRAEMKQSGAAVEANQRELEAMRREATMMKQENSRLRWVAASEELADIKEDAALAFLSVGGVSANKTAMNERLLWARERAAFQRQLDQTLFQLESTKGSLDQARAEITTARAERDALASLKRQAEIEAERATQQLRSMGVETQYQMALSLRDRARKDREAEEEARAYRALKAGQLEAAQRAFEELLARHLDLELQLEHRLANRVPAGRYIILRELAAHNVPDLDEKRGSRTSDPYIKMTLVDADGKFIDDTTTVHKRNQTNPKWTETYRLLMPHGMKLPVTVHLELFDKDWHQADSVIAEAMLSVGLGKHQVQQVLELKEEGTKKTTAKKGEALNFDGKLTIELSHELSGEMFFDP